jgi:hypothetical protein
MADMPNSTGCTKARPLPSESCAVHRHRSYRTLAKCIWPQAYWVAGEGPWASLAHCNVLTIELHRTRATAEAAKRAIDGTGCGGRCHRHHEIVHLALREGD